MRFQVSTRLLSGEEILNVVVWTTVIELSGRSVAATNSIYKAVGVEAVEDPSLCGDVETNAMQDRVRGRGFSDSTGIQCLLAATQMVSILLTKCLVLQVGRNSARAITASFCRMIWSRIDI